jgi:hypothetical protein
MTGGKEDGNEDENDETFFTCILYTYRLEDLTWAFYVQEWFDIPFIYPPIIRITTIQYPPITHMMYKSG